MDVLQIIHRNIIKAMRLGISMKAGHYMTLELHQKLYGVSPRVN
jgi:hypothetical protein